MRGVNIAVVKNCSLKVRLIAALHGIFLATISLVVLGPASAEEVTAETYSLLHDGRVVAVYQASLMPAANPQEPWFGRSGFVHPLLTPTGVPVTSGMPENHQHQHALMFAWTSSMIDQRDVDFWNAAEKEGRIEHTKVVSHSDREIVCKLSHIDQTTTPSQLAIDEKWTVTVAPYADVNVIDLESIQNCRLDRPLVINQYHYGGMCIRGADAWLDSDMTMTTDAGVSREAGNHTRPQYAIMYGKVGDHVCGIAAIAHPSNFRSPQPVRLHPSLPYFCFAPMVLGQFEIKPDEPYASRFRFVAFDGSPDTERLSELYRDFAQMDSKD